MPSSAQTSNGFVDPYNYEGLPLDTSGMAASENPYFKGETGVPGFIRKMFGDDVDARREARSTALNQAYERASIESARAWSEYMDNTQVQRRVKDIEAAGLNPWLAVQNGISGSGAPSVDTGGSAQHTTQSNQSSGLLRVLLMAVAMMARNPEAAGAAMSTSNKVWSMMSKKF